MASNTLADGVRAVGDQSRATSRRSRGPILRVLDTLASLRLTVLLFALAIVLIFAGTLAQVNKDIWEVMDLYFRAWFAWIPLQVFFPASFFPRLAIGPRRVLFSRRVFDRRRHGRQPAGGAWRAVHGAGARRPAGGRPGDRSARRADDLGGGAGRIGQGAGRRVRRAQNVVAVGGCRSGLGNAVAVDALRPVGAAIRAGLGAAAVDRGRSGAWAACWACCSTKARRSCPTPRRCAFCGNWSKPPRPRWCCWPAAS